jgi:hypothetical protein
VDFPIRFPPCGSFYIQINVLSSICEANGGLAGDLPEVMKGLSSNCEAIGGLAGDLPEVMKGLSSNCEAIGGLAGDLPEVMKGLSHVVPLPKKNPVPFPNRSSSSLDCTDYSTILNIKKPPCEMGALANRRF